MICAPCKAPNVDIAHVRACSTRANAARTAPAVTQTQTVKPLLPTGQDNPFLPHLRSTARPGSRPRRAPAVTQTQTASKFVPAGRYAIGTGDELRFYKVDRPSQGPWAGRVFVSVMASDEAHPVRSPRERARILAEIGEDVDYALRRYGREIGKCGHCNRTLTVPASIAEGIGPVCAGRFAAAAA